MYSIVASRSTLLRAGIASVRTGVVASTSRARYNSTSTMHDNDPEVLETEKKRNLTRTQHHTSTPHEHAPGWNESLASESEASLKADASTGSAVELQKRTVEYLHARHSPDERMEPREATYERDEVDSPLSDAKTGDEVIKVKKVHDETTEKFKKPNPTPSEADVKADRGEAV